MTIKQIADAGIVRQMNILRCQHEITSALKNFALGGIVKETPICNVRAVLNWREAQAVKIGNFVIYNN